MYQKNFSLKACRLPSDEIATKNALFVSFNKLSELKSKAGSKDKLYVKVKGKILEILGAEGIEDNGIAMSKLARKLLQIGEEDSVNFEYMYDKQPNKSNLTHIKFKVNPRKKMEEQITVKDTELLEIIKKSYRYGPATRTTQEVTSSEYQPKTRYIRQINSNYEPVNRTSEEINRVKPYSRSIRQNDGNNKDVYVVSQKRKEFYSNDNGKITKFYKVEKLMSDGTKQVETLKSD